MSDWSIDRARQAYSIPHWTEGYFDIGMSGRVIVRPRGESGPSATLADIIDTACGDSARLPLLVRFPQILDDRLARLQVAFADAMRDAGYAGGYTAVYPIKVNQHHAVAGTLAANGGHGFGLEAGSKPELMAVLALSRPGGLVVCNGYKDREYIRLALVGRKLGLETFIVIEKPSELMLVIEVAAVLGVRPCLGVRMRLASLGAGKWQNSGGDKAKFGLSPRQTLDLWRVLCERGMGDCLGFLHFHMGSQISNVGDIANGMREATRYFVELSRLGAHIRYMDVGGGFGIDYEGTRSQSECSINYTTAQYATNVVLPLAEACREHGLAPPRIVTECGRAMTAHHAVLVTDVVEVEPAPEGRVPDARDGEPAAIRHLRALHADLDASPPTAVFEQARHHHREGVALYALGRMRLRDRADIDDIFYAITRALRKGLDLSDANHRALLAELDERLVDKYFVNFSIFESMPDAWAIDQAFPIVPIERLDEPADRRGTIADLTCDSDGAILTYVHDGQLDNAMPLHAVRAGERYRLAFFLVGAYQEILGDIHNLFGDTDAIEVEIDEYGYKITGQRRGDTTDAILDYVGYSLPELRVAYAEKVEGARLPAAEARVLAATLEEGLTGYTYLADTCDAPVRRAMECRG